MTVKNITQEKLPSIGFESLVDCSFCQLNIKDDLFVVLWVRFQWNNFYALLEILCDSKI